MFFFVFVFFVLFRGKRGGGEGGTREGTTYPKYISYSTCHVPTKLSSTYTVFYAAYVNTCLFHNVKPKYSLHSTT